MSNAVKFVCWPAGPALTDYLLPLMMGFTDLLSDLMDPSECINSMFGENRNPRKECSVQLIVCACVHKLWDNMRCQK